MRGGSRNAGRPPTEVAVLLSHARLDITVICTKPGQGDLRDAVAAVEWEEGE